MAFDTVNHEFLFEKVAHYGLRNVTNSWFKIYLNHRKQIVSLNGIDSETQVMQHAVPQESVLGLIFFLILYYKIQSVCVSVCVGPE